MLNGGYIELTGPPVKASSTASVSNEHIVLGLLLLFLLEMVRMFCVLTILICTCCTYMYIRTCNFMLAVLMCIGCTIQYFFF